MRNLVGMAIVALVTIVAFQPAHSTPWSATQGQGWQMQEVAPRSKASRQYAKRMVSAERSVARRTSSGVGARPRKWCGWWMRTQKGGGPEFNVAWNWRKYGSPAGGPQVGAVVVWKHHVGMIVGRAENGKWIVKSGNDGGAVRTRARSVAGAIFRI